MAITKILPRNTGLSQAIQYALNGDKTEHHILTAHQNCDPGREYRQMMNTKSEVGKLDGRQCYHIIQSFKPGEVTPELALEIAKEFAAEYLPDYEVVIGTHVDKGHIHSHIVFNSVNGQTGEKYHVTTQEYYRQIRAISDRLCREYEKMHRYDNSVSLFDGVAGALKKLREQGLVLGIVTSKTRE